MELWAWLVAYLLGFGLLQLYLYRYFIGGRSPGESSTEQATPDSSADQTLPSYAEGRTGAVESGDPAEGSDVVACGDCGAYNERDPAFTYCKECGNRLGR